MTDPNDGTTNEPIEAGYEVGYGRPPRHTRFQPGQSGNANGRPKGTRNLKSDLADELNEKILVREGEQSQRISKQRAVVKTLVSKTLKGDARAAGLLTSMMMRLLDTGEGSPEAVAPLQDDERAILDAFEQRVLRNRGEDEEGADPEPGSDPEGAS